jgi:hypothetical protein
VAEVGFGIVVAFEIVVGVGVEVGVAAVFAVRGTI